MCVSDLQGHAESFDEDAIGSTDRLLSDEAEIDCPPDSSHGVPVADSDVIDESFARYRLPLAKIERLATGCRWAEGPVWLGDTRSLVGDCDAATGSDLWQFCRSWVTEPVLW